MKRHFVDGFCGVFKLLGVDEVFDEKALLPNKSKRETSTVKLIYPYDSLKQWQIEFCSEEKGQQRKFILFLMAK